MMSDRLARLQAWYLSQCNGDWEHSYGIRLETLDNPGWALEVSLAGTDLADKNFSAVKVQRQDEHDWFHCRREGDDFKGFCGPLNLEDVLETFLRWTEEPLGGGGTENSRARS